MTAVQRELALVTLSGERVIKKCKKLGCTHIGRYPSRGRGFWCLCHGHKSRNPNVPSLLRCDGTPVARLRRRS